MTDVIGVFDIGKTNKKIILFNNILEVVKCEEEKFNTIVDDDGFECDDIDRLENWIRTSLKTISAEGEFNIIAINFTTYGASLVYLDKDGKRLAPLYNYLKPLPDGYFNTFYDKYGGVEEFSRKTASPPLGMLNSGMQVMWLKKEKPDVYKKVRHILHFPQYLSYLLTNTFLSEYTSIGCHTAMWDFDKMEYHSWLADENVPVEAPVTNNFITKVMINNKPLVVGTGLHDSSSSLVPYLFNCKEKFVLISTGTWCINMNPFNHEPLSTEQLRSDCLSYLSIHQQPVKSSRLFMGHIHDVNVSRLNEYFQVPEDYYKSVLIDELFIRKRIITGKPGQVFFLHPNSSDYIDNSVNPGQFKTFEEAYHQLVADMTELCIDSLNLVVHEPDDIGNIYVTGGFARNRIFMNYLSSRLTGNNIIISEIDNSTALGAALVLWDEMNKSDHSRPVIDLVGQE